ncbi:DMT family transporter [Desulfovibrio subterraneus]|jgi:transporter family-2 protein|uniref:Membrane protein n=1 Tax=Desulfovibrio subterraneus TaxID=2718620 RepID=A0A7J0BGP6_9BACT|nr:DMT family transporter [Desulfovibrio subterraneus]GFM32362.1 membrane protein [Desulfovibrio subterraneus]
MNALFLIGLALLAGATLPTQAGINAQLQLHWAKHPALASLVSFSVGTAALVAYCVAARVPFPSLAGSTTQWWHWIGGLLGAVFVTVVTFLAPRLGAATMVGLVIAGQMIASVSLDHFGLLGYAERPLSMMRFVGVALLVCGVVLIRRF